MNITIQRRERQIGPYTVWEVNRRLRDGELSLDLMAWQEGTPEWVPLKMIPGIGVSDSPKPQAVKPKPKRFTLWIAVGLAVLVLIDIGIRLRTDEKTPVLEQEKKWSKSGEPQKSGTARVAESAKQKQTTAEKAANARRIRGRVLQVTEQGLLVIAKEDEPVFGVGNSTGNGGGVFIPSGRTDKHGAGRPAEIYGSFFVSGHPKQATLVDDADIDVDAYQDGVVSYTTAIGARRTVKLYAVIKAFE